MNLYSSDVENASKNAYSFFYLIKLFIVVVVLGIFYPIYLLGHVGLIGIAIMVFSMLVMVVSSAERNLKWLTVYA